MLAKCKLKSIEKIISQTLIDVGISHEELKTTINEENYERILEWWKVKITRILEKIMELGRIKKIFF